MAVKNLSGSGGQGRRGQPRLAGRSRRKSPADLPDGDVLVRVKYSSLNYKDVLSATGNRGVTRRYPHTPGIDAAGVVEESSSPDFKAGDEVIVTSYDLGMNTPGGFGQFIRVPAAWVVKLPQGLSWRESMIYGTAGFTAALSVYRLMDYGVGPARGEVLVSGATGGVGSVAVAILAKEGFRVTAMSGRPENRDYLLSIGAHEVIAVDAATDASPRPLLKERWAGAIDTVGGPVLATTIKSVMYGGGITCCGNVGLSRTAPDGVPLYPAGHHPHGHRLPELPHAHPGENLAESGGAVETAAPGGNGHRNRSKGLSRAD